MGLLKKISRWQHQRHLKQQAREQIFSDIGGSNAWEGKQSISGFGSDLEDTETIRRELPALFKQWGITSMLDIPCGDFNWMQRLDLSGIHYTGADIVPWIVEQNQQYANDNIRFAHLDLVKDELPQVDLIFARDCLVHLSHADVFSALKNIVRSQSKYLLTTTFPTRKKNKDIATGEWRTLNLQRPPFSLPPAAHLLVEACTAEQGIYADKSLGLWKISDLNI